MNRKQSDTRPSLRESNQALFNTTDILEVDQKIIDVLKRRALQAPTRRFRLCLHHSPDEVVQEMVIVHCRDNYSRPHRHTTPSSCTIFEGELSVFLFDEDGKVTRRIDLGVRESGKPFSLRIGAGVWHVPVCRSEQLVFYETMTGPFRRESANDWAPWSPDEDDPGGISGYLSGLGIDWSPPQVTTDERSSR
jgi:glucose-6-phosphate isomerase